MSAKDYEIFPALFNAYIEEGKKKWLENTIMSKEHKVGETFQYGDIQIRVEKEKHFRSCEGCCFKNIECFRIDRERCVGYENEVGRKDGENVIFVEVL